MVESRMAGSQEAQPIRLAHDIEKRFNYPPDTCTFAELLHWHLYVHGTRPNGRRKLWEPQNFIDKARCTDRSLRRYLGEGAPPDQKNLGVIKEALLDKPPQNQEWADDLENARIRSRRNGNLWTAPGQRRRSRRSKAAAASTEIAVAESVSGDATPDTAYSSDSDGSPTPEHNDDTALNLRHATDAGPNTSVQGASITRSQSISLAFPALFTPRLPPALHAEPNYIASHEFVGRQEQIATLNAWAAADDPNAVLLLVAMGGTGKSFLAWHWITQEAVKSETKWAGRFWYSFYEPHANVYDFHCRLLSYMSGQPVEIFQNFDLKLLHATAIDHLQRAPWLVVLDGVERLLIQYQRLDAHYVDDADTGGDVLMGQRDGCAVIRGEDALFLRALSSVSPSKVLVTTRLVPSCMVSPALRPIPGVRIFNLPGLNPEEACAMMRASGVTGDAKTMAHYLKDRIDCHPLVTGILAGIIISYLPARGDFDVWVKASDGGLLFNPAEEKLTQRHNDILDYAVGRLPPDCHRLLSMMALLSSAMDYSTIAAMAAPAFADSASESPTAQQADTEASVSKRLQQAVKTLEVLGLVQFDHASRRYDIHPVVRARVAWQMLPPQRKRFAQFVVDHFTSASIRPFNEAQSVADIVPGLEIFHALILSEDYGGALNFFENQLHHAIRLVLDRSDLTLTLIRPFFRRAWSELRPEISGITNYLFNWSGLALEACDFSADAYLAHQESLAESLTRNSALAAVVDLANLAETLASLQQGDLAYDTHRLALRLAQSVQYKEGIFFSRLSLFEGDTDRGDYAAAQEHWDALNPMGRAWSPGVYRQGDAELAFAHFLFYQGRLTEDALATAEHAAQSPFSRRVRRNIAALRGMWRMSEGDWLAAHEALLESVRLKPDAKIAYEPSDIQLLRAKLKLQQITVESSALKMIEPVSPAAEIDLAELRFDMGDFTAARRHAVRAMEWGTAQGFCKPHAFVQARAAALINKMPPSDHAVVLSPSHGGPARPAWFDRAHRLTDLIETANESGEVSDEIVRYSGHLIHKLKAKDSTGRWAYYFVLVPASREADFIKAIEADGTVDLELYGKVVASCYGEEPTAEVRAYLSEKFGFDVL